MNVFLDLELRRRQVSGAFCDFSTADEDGEASGGFIWSRSGSGLELAEYKVPFWLKISLWKQR